MAQRSNPPKGDPLAELMGGGGGSKTSEPKASPAARKPPAVVPPPAANKSYASAAKPATSHPPSAAGTQQVLRPPGQPSQPVSTGTSNAGPNVNVTGAPTAVPSTRPPAAQQPPPQHHQVAAFQPVKYVGVGSSTNATNDMRGLLARPEAEEILRRNGKDFLKLHGAKDLYIFLKDFKWHAASAVEGGTLTEPLRKAYMKWLNQEPLMRAEDLSKLAQLRPSRAFPGQAGVFAVRDIPPKQVVGAFAGIILKDGQIGIPSRDLAAEFGEQKRLNPSQMQTSIVENFSPRALELPCVEGGSPGAEGLLLSTLNTGNALSFLLNGNSPAGMRGPQPNCDPYAVRMGDKCPLIIVMANLNIAKDTELILDCSKLFYRQLPTIGGYGNPTPVRADLMVPEGEIRFVDRFSVDPPHLSVDWRKPILWVYPFEKIRAMRRVFDRLCDDCTLKFAFVNDKVSVLRDDLNNSQLTCAECKKANEEAKAKRHNPGLNVAVPGIHSQQVASSYVSPATASSIGAAQISPPGSAFQDNRQAQQVGYIDLASDNSPGCIKQESGFRDQRSLSNSQGSQSSGDDRRGRGDDYNRDGNRDTGRNRSRSRSPNGRGNGRNDGNYGGGRNDGNYGSRNDGNYGGGGRNDGSFGGGRNDGSFGGGGRNDGNYGGAGRNNGNYGSRNDGNYGGGRYEDRGGSDQNRGGGGNRGGYGNNGDRGRYDQGCDRRGGGYGRDNRGGRGGAAVPKAAMDSSGGRANNSAGSTGSSSGGLPLIRFLKVEGLSDELKAFMAEAFEISQKINSEATWITEEECLQINERVAKHYFICAKFEGLAFEHLCRLNYRIFGPQCFCFTFRQAGALPKLPHPVYQISMRGLYVCCSQLAKPVREKVYKKVQWMGGSISREFLAEVTHLVSTDVTSRKYKMAASLGKTVVSPEWVDEAWQLGCSEPLDAADKDFCARFRLQTFQGLTITTTNLTVAERNYVEQTVLANGGTYSGELIRGKCTTLVTNEAKGSKYEAARKWGTALIKTVTMQWLTDSVERGFALDETLYRVPSEGQKVSTPTDDQRRSVVASAFNPDCSAIVPPPSGHRHGNAPNCRLDFNSTTISNASVILRSANGSTSTDVSRVNESTLPPDKNDAALATPRRQSKAVAPGAKGKSPGRASKETSKVGPSTAKEKDGKSPGRAAREKDKDGFVRPGAVTLTTKLRKRPDPNTPQASKQLQTSVIPEDAAGLSSTSKILDETPIEDLDLSIATSGDFLAKCCVFLSGFERRSADKLRRIVGAGGGKMSATLDKNVTHVLLHTEKRESKHCIEDLNVVRNRKLKCAILLPQWLIHSFKSGQLLPIGKYQLDANGCPLAGTSANLTASSSATVEESPSGIPRKRTKLKEGSSSTESTPKAGPAPLGQNARKTTVQDEEHVLSQYMPQDSGALGDSTLMRALDDIEGPNGAIHGRENDVEMADNEADKIPAPAAVPDADKRVRALPRYVDPSMETLDPVDMELDRMNEADEDTTVNAAANITDDATTTSTTTNNNPNITSDADSEKNKSAPAAEVSEARAAPCLFDAKRFYLHGFGADGEDLEAENEVVEHGGTMVDDPDVAHFILCPVVLTPKAAAVFSNFQPESVIRSLLWLEMSIEANNLLPGGNNEFFAPYASTAFSSQPLKDCVLSISQYIGRERDFLTDLATKMGAVVQECFARTLRENQLPNTHLLLSKPEGQKFEAAVKWGVHVVNKGWLLETLKAGVRQPEQLYKVCVEQSSADEMDSNERLHLTDDESPQANRAEMNAQPCNANGLAAAQSITPLNNRVRALRLSSSTAGRDSLGDASFNRGPLPTADDWDTPSKFTDPNKSFHPNFDLGDAMKFLQTPEAERQRRERDNSMDLGEYLDQQLCLAAQNTAKAPACYGPSVNTDDLRDNAARASTVCNLAMEEERQQQNSYTPILTGPLTGVVMVVSKKLSGQQRELNEMAHKLGAKYLWTYDKSCTHFLFEGRNNDSAKDFRLAKEHGKFVVHSAWLTACKEDNARVDEKLYPHTFSPLRQSQRKPRPTVARIVPSNSQRSSQQSSQEPSTARPNGTSSPVAMATGRGRITSAVETTPIFRRPTLADMARPLNVNAASVLPAALDAAASSPTILAPPKAASMTDLAAKTPSASRQGSADSNEGDASVVFSQEVMTTVVKRKETAKDIAMDEDKNAPTSPTAADVRFNLNAYLSEVCSNKQNSRKFATNRVNKENKTADSAAKAAPGGEASNSCDSSAASTSDTASHPKPVDLLSSGTSLVEWDDPHQRRERQRIGPLIRGRTEATQSLDCDGDVYVPGIADDQQQQAGYQDDSANAAVGTKLVTVVEEIDDDISIVAEIPANGAKSKATNSAPSSAASASASRGGEMLTKNSVETMRKPTTSNEKQLTRGASLIGNKANTASAAPSTFESEMPCAQQHSKPPSPLATPTTAKYRFMLSAFGSNEKTACKDLIETMLGGVILESNNFDPSCTHIIAKTLSKNEKLLAGIATGKWILQSSYLEACAAAKRFVDEATYEWTVSKEQPQLASACRLWRLKLAKQNPSGAFHGWKALFCLDGSDREASVRRLLEFGGATVQSMSAATVSRSDRFTHALLDIEKTSLCKYEDLPTLKSYGIRCFKSNYIAAYLTKDKEEFYRL